MTQHKITHIELSSSDLEAMKRFYGQVFGWQFTDFPEMNYTTFNTGDPNLGGGFNPVNENNPAGAIFIYIHTDDLGKTSERIAAAGGRITEPELDIPGVGKIGFFKDPTGNHMALLEPAPQT